jgi:uncharacterized membrane protein
VKAQLWRRLAVSAAAGTAAYLGARAVRRTMLADHGDRRSYLHSVTINRSPEEVYGFCRDLPNIARALERIVRVDELDDQRSRWVIEGPGSSEIEFIAEIVMDEPQRVIAWRVEDPPVPHEGRVEFTPAPGLRGTEVRAWLTYVPQAGPNGHVAGGLPGIGPDRLLRDGLRRVKQVLEAGEVIVSDGYSSGRDSMQGRLSELMAHLTAMEAQG